jgi:hypothetical protein
LKMFSQKMRATHREIQNTQNFHLGDYKCQWIIMIDKLLTAICTVVWQILLKNSWPTDSLKFSNESLFHFWTKETLNTALEICQLLFRSCYWNNTDSILILSENWTFITYFLE